MCFSADLRSGNEMMMNLGRLAPTPVKCEKSVGESINNSLWSLLLITILIRVPPERISYETLSGVEFRFNLKEDPSCSLRAFFN